MIDDFDTNITCEEYYVETNDYSYTITEEEYAAACAELGYDYDVDVPF